ncbi:hypothetical protein KJ903_05700 [Patescibacteria group bacterium]|nr:hypothetical protein [Patescibacteria group bacterium]
MTTEDNKSAGHKISPAFLVLESIIFLLAQFLGLLLAWRLLQIEEIRAAIEAQSISVVQFLISFAIGTIVILLLIKFVKRDTVFRLALQASIFLGALLFFDVWLPTLATVLVALAIALLRQYLPIVLVHNIAIVLALAGIGAYIGTGFSAWQILIIIAILSVYDIIAVFRTKHMVKMFTKLTNKGATFSIIVPSRLKNILSRLSKVKLDGSYSFLGTGDIALPLMLAVAALKMGWQYSLAVVIGALVGLIVMHWLQLKLKYNKPVAALPPIGGGAMLGFLVAHLTNMFL